MSIGEKVRYIEDDNRLCVFHIIHKSDKDIYLRGMMEATDFFEGVENPIYYPQENGEWKYKKPHNPYDEDSINYERFKELIDNFNPDKDFKEWLYMANDKGPDISENEKYFLEMESIYYGD